MVPSSKIEKKGEIVNLLFAWNVWSTGPPPQLVVACAMTFDGDLFSILISFW